MDDFHTVDARRAPRRRRGFNLIWNILTVILLVLTLCVVAIVFTIYVNPNSAWNPFPPPTLYPSPVLPSATSTLRMTLEPSWTPTFGIPTQTATPAPTNTPLVSATSVDLSPSRTPVVQATVTPDSYDFVLKEGDPKYLSGETFHPEMECNWVGVAGQVLGLNGEPLVSLFIHLGGAIEEQTYDLVTITGSAPIYGAGGYEFIIANRLVGTTGTLWIQLEDVQGLPMSDRIYFNTYAECERNLAVVNLQQMR
jgi:hypothetical protein